MKSLVFATITLVVAVSPGASHSQSGKPSTETYPMTFEKCLASIRNVASELGVAPINVVETNILRMVRFNTVDGTVLVSCSKPDSKMAVTFTPKQ